MTALVRRAARAATAWAIAPATAGGSPATAVPLVLAIGLLLASGPAHPAAGQDVTTLPQPRTLAEVVARVLEVHPSIEAADQAARASATGVRAARAAWLPALAVQASAVRYQEPMVVAPIHGFDPALIPDFDRTLVQGSLALDYTVFDGGRRGAEVDQAQALEGASQAELAEARAALIERTVQAYLALQTALDLVDAQQAMETALVEERARVQRFLDEGAAPRLELLRADAELAGARADGEGARRALALAVATLAHLLDEDPDVVRSWALQEVGLPNAVPPGAPALGAETVPAANAAPPIAPEDLSASPRVAAALREAAAADAGRSAARAAWIPTLSAIGGYALFAGGGTGATGEWQAGVRVRYPLFTGGARDAAVDLATARARAARARAEVVREEVALAVDRARTAEDEARARMQALEAALTSYTELVRVERLALDEGSGVQSDYLRAVAGLNQARAGFARARRDVLAARVHHARALGQLTLAWIDDLTEEQP